ncbi:hypothetical protein ACP6PL_21335 [Dapis sp. BLCC M126]|uniref:hypothetical protein n=1 Tax=Dapis sp. BLCC M126 TaxID=3400189 RepID=UPI003CEA2C00
MTSDYYNYQDIAKEANSIIGNNNCQIIELGIGTGLLAQEYINIDPTCEFTGVYFTYSL